MTLSRDAIAARLARDIPEGWHVNLGIGMPENVANHLGEREVVLHSENGILGMGPTPAPGEEDPNLINAGKKPVTMVTGASIFDHALSFAIVRGGHLDLCVLGAYQVGANGDLANWSRDAGDLTPAIGGAMDLGVGAKRVWAILQHTDKSGAARILERCTYPLTAPGCVTRIYTDLAVIAVEPDGLVVEELVGDLPFEAVAERTGAPLRTAGERAASAA